MSPNNQLFTKQAYKIRTSILYLLFFISHLCFRRYCEGRLWNSGEDRLLHNTDQEDAMNVVQDLIWNGCFRWAEEALVVWLFSSNIIHFLGWMRDLSCSVGLFKLDFHPDSNSLYQSSISFTLLFSLSVLMTECHLLVKSIWVCLIGVEWCQEDQGHIWSLHQSCSHRSR